MDSLTLLIPLALLWYLIDYLFGKVAFYYIIVKNAVLFQLKKKEPAKNSRSKIPKVA